MNPDAPEALAEIEELCSLVKTGQLFAVQKWLAEGKSHRLPTTDDNRVCPLLVAVGSGFHSMVEVLAKAGGWPQETLDAAFEAATSNHRSDIASLLRQQGASMQALDFAEVCRSMNQTFMEEALRGGCSAVQGNAFATALRRSAAARPPLSFYRRMRGEFPELDNQAALALAIAARDKKARAAALLVWAGADPFREVPYDEDDDNWDFQSDGEWHHTTTAAECAVGAGKPDIVKSLKLKPTLAQMAELMERASWQPSKELAQVLQALLPNQEPNISDRKSCPALESLVRRSKPINFGYGIREKEEPKVIECIEAWLEAGARWNPPLDQVRDIRRSLVEHEPLHVVRVIRLLLYTPNAADPKLVLELCRTPKFRRQLHAGDPELWQELTALSKGIAPYESSVPVE